MRELLESAHLENSTIKVEIKNLMKQMKEHGNLQEHSALRNESGLIGWLDKHNVMTSSLKKAERSEMDEKSGGMLMTVQKKYCQERLLEDLMHYQASPVDPYDGCSSSIKKTGTES